MRGRACARAPALSTTERLAGSDLKLVPVVQSGRAIVDGDPILAGSFLVR
jgi:hypothetical protein